MSSALSTTASTHMRESIVAVEQDGRTLYCHSIPDHRSPASHVPRLTIETGHENSSVDIDTAQQSIGMERSMSGPWIASSGAFEQLSQHNTYAYPKPVGMLAATGGPSSAHVASYDPYNSRSESMQLNHPFVHSNTNQAMVWTPGHPSSLNPPPAWRPEHGYTHHSPLYSPATPTNEDGPALQIPRYMQRDSGNRYTTSPSSSYEGPLGDMEAPRMAYQHSSSSVRSQGLAVTDLGLSVSPSGAHLRSSPTPGLAMSNQYSPLPSQETAYHNQNASYYPAPTPMSSVSAVTSIPMSSYPSIQSMQGLSSGTPMHYSSMQGVPSTYSQSTETNVWPASASHLAMELPNFPGETKEQRRHREDLFILAGKKAGMSYRDIKIAGNIEGAESTLRGRFRNMTKRKDERVRKPVWTPTDDCLLMQGVKYYTSQPGSSTKPNDIPWKKVARYIVDRHGSYLFGNATCKKRWEHLLKEGYRMD